MSGLIFTLALILILGVLIFVHELGHFLVAKWNKIRVDEFGFGYPPRALTLFKKGETVYTLNWIPFGGFVKIFGENPDAESVDGPDRERSMVHKKKRVQAAVLAAGVFFNLVFAWLLLSIAFMAGTPASISSVQDPSQIDNPALTVVSVQKDSPAETGGLLPGDAITSITTNNGVITEPSIDQIQEAIRSSLEQEITFEVLRGNDTESILVTPSDDVIEGQPAVGIAMDIIGTLQLPVHQAIWEGIKSTGALTWGTVKAFGQLIADAFRGQADVQTLTGPVGLVGIVGDASQFGFIYVLMLTAFISINLAVINLVPFPALDGGRLLFLAIEAVKGSPIKHSVANALNGIGFLLLIGLMIVVTVFDVLKLF